jgi:hypothetical protein
LNKQSVGVPTVRSMGSAFGDFGVGVLGGAIYQVVRNLFGGNNVLGSLAAPIAAGSILKGDRGRTISVVAGFSAAADLLSGLGGLVGGGTSTNQRGSI